MSMQRGTLVVVAVVLLAATLSGVAWWHQWQRGHAALDFWGTDAAMQIRTGDYAEFLWLVSVEPVRWTDSESEPLRIGSASRWAESRQTATDWPGLAHLRQALIDDPSYDAFADADTSTPDTTAEWDVALRFAATAQSAANGNAVWVILDSATGRVHHPARARTAQWNDFVSDGFRRFLRDHPRPNPPPQVPVP